MNDMEKDAFDKDFDVRVEKTAEFIARQNKGGEWNPTLDEYNKKIDNDEKE